MLIKFFGKLVPFKIKKQLIDFKILSINYGQWNSIKREKPLDKNLKPIPWYTYPAIEYLKQLNFSTKKVFEWGSGNSSLFWAKRSKKILSIEDNKEWFEFIKKDKLKNQEIQLCVSKEKYLQALGKSKEEFDIIIIDGIHREECTKQAIKYLNPKGVIIFDNSDWFPESTELLRKNNFIQVDFNGFGPINQYTWTTSLFFSKNFDWSCYKDKALSPIGGIKRK